MLEVSLRTLAQLVSSTGYVVLPYLEYPQLMSTILSVMQRSDAPIQVRLQAMSCLGTLGAIEPEKVKELKVESQGQAHAEGTKQAHSTGRGGATVLGVGDESNMLARFKGEGHQAGVPYYPEVNASSATLLDPFLSNASRDKADSIAFSGTISSNSAVLMAGERRKQSRRRLSVVGARAVAQSFAGRQRMVSTSRIQMAGIRGREVGTGTGMLLDSLPPAPGICVHLRGLNVDVACICCSTSTSRRAATFFISVP